MIAKQSVIKRRAGKQAGRTIPRTFPN